MYNFVVSYLGGKREDWGWARIFMPGKPGEVSQAGMHQLIEQGSIPAGGLPRGAV